MAQFHQDHVYQITMGCFSLMISNCIDASVQCILQFFITNRQTSHDDINKYYLYDEPDFEVSVLTLTIKMMTRNILLITTALNAADNNYRDLLD